jgi:hypothetical protein
VYGLLSWGGASPRVRGPSAFKVVGDMFASVCGLELRFESFFFKLPNMLVGFELECDKERRVDGPNASPE